LRFSPHLGWVAAAADLKEAFIRKFNILATDREIEAEGKEVFTNWYSNRPK
jgi:hypothetical protein